MKARPASQWTALTLLTCIGLLMLISLLGGLYILVSTQGWLKLF